MYNRACREGLRPLGDHKFRRGVKTAYFFDTYEFTRWFSDRLLWNTVPGDVTTVPDVPSIVKSRPICGDNANSVLLNLDKVRHFIFLRDDIPFRKKSDKAIFRLAITRRPHRERFMRMYFGSECCDAGISTPRPEYPPEWTKPHISMYDHLNYKFILAIEGYDVATNLKWIMSSNSLAVILNFFMFLPLSFLIILFVVYCSFAFLIFSCTTCTMYLAPTSALWPRLYTYSSTNFWIFS